MNLFRNIFRKAVLPAIMMLSSLSLFAAEAAPAPPKSLNMTTNPVMFYVLVGIGVLLFILITVLAGVLKNLVSNKNLWLKKPGTGGAAGIIIFALMMMSGASAFAQAAATPPAPSNTVLMTEDVFWLLLVADLILFAIFVSMLRLVRNMTKTLRGMDVTVSSAQGDIWSGALNAAVPIEREGDIMTDHEYDGIRELDNNLPPWWIYGFYVTIVIAVVYFSYYHILGKGDLQVAQYEKEMAEGQRQKEAYIAKAGAKVDETTVVAFTDAENLEKGKTTFKTYCVPCHGPDGQGVVGPNLTDEYWINGGGIKNIFKTIKYGVPAKGMISWEAQLSPAKIQEVGSYILTLKGTNPPNPKDPQGDVWKEELPQAKPDSLAADTAGVAAGKK